MKHWLLIAGILGLLGIAAPAHAQYIFLDVNGDGACTSADVLSSSTTAVDVWLDTNHEHIGNTVTCGPNPSQPLDMFSYDILFHAAGSGTVTYNTWTNTASGFTQLNALTISGSDAGVGYSAPIGANLSPGLYQLGTLGVTITGTPTLTFIGESTNPAIPSPVTGFGSSCDATTYLNTITLGVDFDDSCGTSGLTTEVLPTTWGKIKQLYR